MNSIFNRPTLQERNIAADFMSDLGPGMHPRVSILGGQFAMIGADGNRYGAPCIVKNTPQGQKLVMLAIIIGSNPKKSRIFYENKYDPDNPAPPDCYSDNGIAPSVNASSPQARTCGECIWQKWGSDTSQLTGKPTKACSEKKKLGILIVGDTTQHVYELQAPPVTLKNMAEYGAKVSAFSLPGANRKADLCDVVTEISFVSGQTGVLEFNGHCLIDSAFIDPNGAIQIARNGENPTQAPDGGAAVAQLMDEIWDSDELDEILGIKDQPFVPPAGFIAPGMQGYLEHQPHGGALQRGATTGAVPPPPTAASVDPNSPFVPPPGVIAQQPQTLPVAGQAGASAAAAPAAAPARQRKPRTTRGAGAAAPAAALSAPAGPTVAVPAQGDGMEIPGFLQRRQAAAAPAANPAPATNGAAQSFGNNPAPAPSGSMEAAIGSAFALSTRRG